MYYHYIYTRQQSSFSLKTLKLTMDPQWTNHGQPCILIHHSILSNVIFTVTSLIDMSFYFCYLWYFYFRSSSFFCSFNLSQLTCSLTLLVITLALCESLMQDLTHHLAPTSYKDGRCYLSWSSLALYINLGFRNSKPLSTILF